MTVTLEKQVVRSESVDVVVRNASKSYGWGKSSTMVLNGLNMTIHKGTMYVKTGVNKFQLKQYN